MKINNQTFTKVPDGIYLAQINCFKKGLSSFGIDIKWVFTIVDGAYKEKEVLGLTDPKPKNPRKFKRWLKPFDLVPTDVWDNDKCEQTSQSPVGQHCQIFVFNGYVKEIVAGEL